MQVVYDYVVCIDCHDGVCRDVTFKTYRDAKAYYGKVPNSVPYKSIVANTDEGTKVVVSYGGG